MSFFREIANKLGERALGGYNIINFNGEYLYLEGVDRLLTLSPEKVEFSAFGKVVSVEGAGLAIDELGGGCAIIKGSIKSESVFRP